MGRGKGKGKKTEAGGKMWEAEPQECGETKGAARPPEWTLSPTEWGRGAERTPEGRHGVGRGVESP